MTCPKGTLAQLAKTTLLKLEMPSTATVLCAIETRWSSVRHTAPYPG